jgi:hypothetical protein
MYFLLVANLLPGHLLPRRLDQPLQLRQVVRRHLARKEGQESHDTVRFEKRKKTLKWTFSCVRLCADTALEEGPESHDTVRFEKRKTKNEEKKTWKWTFSCVRLCADTAREVRYRYHRNSSVADPDPGSGAFLTPGSGMGKNSGSGFGMNNPDHISESLKNNFLGLKYLDSFTRIRDGKSSDPGSGINIPDPQHWRTGTQSRISRHHWKKEKLTETDNVSNKD